MMEWVNNLTTFQFLILIFGGGAGLAIFGFTATAFVNTVIRPKLFNDDGTTKFISRIECEKSTGDYRTKICNELKDIKDRQEDFIDFANALKGYYIGKGVKF